MAEYDLAGQLYYVRHGIEDRWRALYADANEHTHPFGELEAGLVVYRLGENVHEDLRWINVRGHKTDPGSGGPFSPTEGHIKEPRDGAIDVLARLPIKEYEGVPSLLAVDDFIVLAEDHPDRAEAVYTDVPDHESARPTAGVVGPQDLARIVRGPRRTPNNVLYWYVSNEKGPGQGWVREAARAGTRYRPKIMPYRLAHNR